LKALVEFTAEVRSEDKFFVCMAGMKEVRDVMRGVLLPDMELKPPADAASSLPSEVVDLSYRPFGQLHVTPSTEGLVSSSREGSQENVPEQLTDNNENKADEVGSQEAEEE
jgi:hypothetical protein